MKEIGNNGKSKKKSFFFILFLTSCIATIYEEVLVKRSDFLQHLYQEELLKNYYWQDEVKASYEDDYYKTDKYYDLNKYSTTEAAANGLIQDVKYSQDKWSEVKVISNSEENIEANVIDCLNSKQKNQFINNINYNEENYNSRYANTILTIDSKKVGFLDYCEFDEDSVVELVNLFNYWYSHNLTEIIIDLTTNSGGRVDVAWLLGSLIYYNDAENNQVFTKLNYHENSDFKEQIYYFASLETILREFKGTNDLENLQNNSLNIKRVIFLTSFFTASASEMLIIGIKPFIEEVVVIGDNTSGKGYGKREYNNYGFTISLINFRYLNGNQKGIDFSGIIPDEKISNCSEKNNFFRCSSDAKAKAEKYIKSHPLAKINLTASSKKGLPPERHLESLSNNKYIHFEVTLDKDGPVFY